MPLRYAILHHYDIAEPHYDVLVETEPGSMLAAWRAERWPIGGGDVLVRLPDHRPTYLTYEGPVSGRRGTVRRVGDGAFSVQFNGPDECTVNFDGIGRFRLLRRDEDRWEVRVVDA